MATALPRLLAGAAAALLAAGVSGLVIHGSTPKRGEANATTTIRAAITTTTTTSPGDGPPGPGPAALTAGLVDPTDMGGYYRVVPDAAASLLDSAPCLAALQASPAQSGRALSALLGPDEHSVPYLIEEVASYPGSRAGAVYRSVATSIDACPSLTFAFAGTGVTASIEASSIAPVGDADQVWSGSFGAGGSFTVQIGLVLDGPDVLAIIWIDSVPASPAVMGSFASTVSLAIGKLA